MRIAPPVTRIYGGLNARFRRPLEPRKRMVLYGACRPCTVASKNSPHMEKAKKYFKDLSKAILNYRTAVRPVEDEPHSYGAMMPALTEAYRNGINEVTSVIK